jgi:flagellar biosynthesis component FlhA
MTTRQEVLELIEDAAKATELMSEDELEQFANEKRTEKARESMDETLEQLAQDDIQWSVDNAARVAKLKGPRPIYVIAEEIRNDWKKVNYGAVPYLEAMASLKSIDDTYGLDPAKEVIIYFLSNASAWRGDTARRVKKELKALYGK